MSIRSVESQVSRVVFFMGHAPLIAFCDSICGICYCFVFSTFVSIYQFKLIHSISRSPCISPLPGDDLLNGSTAAYQLWYVMMATTVVRFKYYHAWLFADAICNNSGIGFNGYDERGKSKWDLISNINVINFEVTRLDYKTIVE